MLAYGWMDEWMDERDIIWIYGRSLQFKIPRGSNLLKVEGMEGGGRGPDWELWPQT